MHQLTSIHLVLVRHELLLGRALRLVVGARELGECAGNVGDGEEVSTREEVLACDQL